MENYIWAGTASNSASWRGIRRAQGWLGLHPNVHDLSPYLINVRPKIRVHGFSRPEAERRNHILIPARPRLSANQEPHGSPASSRRMNNPAL